MKVLLIDIDEHRAKKIDAIITWAGIELLSVTDSDADIYQLVGELHPEIILVDTNSPNRDTLEHLAQLQKGAPRTVINLGGNRSESINRLASEAGISLYAIDAVPTALLQSLIDIAISYFHSVNQLRAEVEALKPTTDARQSLNKAKKFIMDTYGLTEDQATDLLNKNADRQRKPVTDVARQLLDTGSFI
ncbi:MAG: ANTAR domain-containing protein [Zhongshania sp.]|uniref:ANTAR domain-containing response regulator n=1 Tax=Zhongshania sp. TaxID=1971902 RepID=UPI00262E77E2|nr:ANTAR domain-containing protein [Zhongshania sp.]MDF1691532.1 ANTAR domain-containing protein [Zhongshania sp.]